MNEETLTFSDIIEFTHLFLSVHELWVVPVGCKVVGSFYQEGHDPFFVHSFEETRFNGFSLELWCAFNDFWMGTSFAYSGESIPIKVRVEFGPEAYRRATRFEMNPLV